MTSAQEIYLSTQQEITELVCSVTGVGAFFDANHLQTLEEESNDRKKDREAMYKTKFKGLVRNLKGIKKAPNPKPQVPV